MKTGDDLQSDPAIGDMLVPPNRYAIHRVPWMAVRIRRLNLGVNRDFYLNQPRLNDKIKRSTLENIGKSYDYTISDCILLERNFNIL